jgi:hypothetical protein
MLLLIFLAIVINLSLLIDLVRRLISADLEEISGLLHCFNSKNKILRLNDPPAPLLIPRYNNNRNRSSHNIPLLTINHRSPLRRYLIRNRSIPPLPSASPQNTRTSNKPSTGSSPSPALLIPIHNNEHMPNQLSIRHTGSLFLDKTMDLFTIERLAIHPSFTLISARNMELLGRYGRGNSQSVIAFPAPIPLERRFGDVILVLHVHEVEDV